MAVESRDYAALAPYFADDVTLSTNVAQIEPISGRQGVMMVLRGYRMDSRVDAVVVSTNRVVVIQNLVAGSELGRETMGPIIDTYYLNPEGKIQTVERFIGSAGRRRSGS